MMLHMTKVRTRAGGANTPKRGARSAERTQGPMATEDTMLAAAPSFATEALAQVKIAVPVGVNMVASTVRDFITLAFLGRLGQSSSITTANKENKFSLLRLQRRRINRQRQEATHEAVKTSRGGIGACAPTPNVHSPPRIGYRLSRRYH
jgi:hypothetical protein